MYLICLFGIVNICILNGIVFDYKICVLEVLRICIVIVMFIFFFFKMFFVNIGKEWFSSLRSSKCLNVYVYCIICD